MAITLRYFTEFGKHTFQHITAASICGGIYEYLYFAVTAAISHTKLKQAYNKLTYTIHPVIQKRTQLIKLSR